MNPMDPSNFLPEESARYIAEQRQRMREADQVVRYAHSRTGMLARFLQRLADGIDPTKSPRNLRFRGGPSKGEARRTAPRR